MEAGVQYFSYSVVCGVVTFIFSALICFMILRRWGFSIAGWDRGDMARKAQASPILRLGGVGIAGAFILLVLILSVGIPGLPAGGGMESYYLLTVCLLFFLLGLIDDLFQIPALLKLGVQVMIAVAAYSMGYQIDLITNPINGASIEIGALSPFITILWIIAVPNLINLADGMDGIAGGVCIALLATLGVVSWMGGKAIDELLSAGMLGAVAGFLIFNLPRARLYLGDGGAYLLGAFIACISISSSQKGPIAGSLLIVMLSLALPIADATFAILRRSFYGFPIWQGDREHIHHRLVTMGLRRGTVITIMISCVVVFSLLGLLLLINGRETWPVVFTVVVGGTVVLMRKLGYWGSFQAFIEHVRRIRVTRRKVRYACALGTVLEHELDWSPSSREFWADFQRSLIKVGLHPLYGEADQKSSEMEVLEMPLADGSLWRLRYRKEFEEMHWGKVAASFLGPLSRGINKWGEVAEEIGVTPPIVPTSSFPARLDESTLVT